MNEKYPFIILAGSPKIRDPLMEYADVDYKTLIEINGKTLLNYVLEAIIETGKATHILITGVPENKVTLPENIDKSIVTFFEIEGPVVTKIHQGALKLIELFEDNPSIFPGERRHTVVVSGDIPAITGEMINDYIDTCDRPEVKYFPTVVHRDDMERVFPNSGRSWIYIRGGNAYCSGDLDMVDVYTLRDNYELIKTLTENRKSFIGSLLRISPFVLIKYLLKIVKISEVEGIITKLFKFPTAVAIVPHPELAFDVDKPYQLDMMREFITKRSNQI